MCTKTKLGPQVVQNGPNQESGGIKYQRCHNIHPIKIKSQGICCPWWWCYIGLCIDRRPVFILLSTLPLWGFLSFDDHIPAYFDVFILTPPERYPYHFSTPSTCPLVFPTMKHACDESGYKIIHAYVQLISDTTSYIKQWLLQEKRRTDHESTNNQ